MERGDGSEKTLKRAKLQISNLFCQHLIRPREMVLVKLETWVLAAKTGPGKSRVSVTRK